MKYFTLFLLFIITLPVASQKSDFSKEWQFRLNDTITESTLDNLADSDWRVVNIPHDWSIEGEYHQTKHGSDWQSGFLPGGTGWYRKDFAASESWKNKKVQILFDGVYPISEVWINGNHLGKYTNGYIGFTYDLTPYLKKEANQIIVKVDHHKPLTGRWYTGSGIYRPVSLLVSNTTHIPYSGIHFQSTNVSKQSADYTVDVEIESPHSKDIGVYVYIEDGNGNIVSQTNRAVNTKKEKIVTVNGSVINPSLWSPDAPDTYTLVTQLKDKKRVIDENRILIGFRKLEYSCDEGFKLNDISLKLKGVCDHHTAGAVGAAVPDDVLYYRLKLLKEMGCNAIRTAHNPFSPDFYTICDTLGIMVMNEGLDGWETPKARDDYGNYFADNWEKDMTSFIRRDRNHPSVIAWSIGNEVSGATPETQKKLVELFHSLAPGQAVTQGGIDPTRNMTTDYDKDFRYLDIIGFNGNGEEVGEFEKFRANFPGKCAIATEVPHTYQTRGVYRTRTHWRRRDFPAPWEKGDITWDQFKHRVFEIPDLSVEEFFPEEQEYPYYQSSYDNASVRISIRHSWQRTLSFPWLMGEFRWGSFDYLGEAEWPQRCGNFGIIDVAAMPKDAYYLYKSLWNEQPMVHLLPHWSHPGKEGKEIPMVVYTNCDEVELFLNNRSLGKHTYTGEQLVWAIPYEPGRIEAKGFKNGQEVASAVQQTADTPYTVSYNANKTNLRANTNDVARIEIDIVDKNGTLCPLASNALSFCVQGPVQLLGVDNGDPTAMFAYQNPYCDAFRGKCVVLLRAAKEKGVANLIINGEGLEEITIPLIIE